MLVFNQQANIKNVNGAIADIFANRPAPQSTFYLFYSTDTQEIYYDNGAWILIGSGGGGVNIYNSDGTLTTDRYLDGNNKQLNFFNLLQYSIIAQNLFLYKTGTYTGLEFNQFYNRVYLGAKSNSNNNTHIQVNEGDAKIETYYGSNPAPQNIGLKLEFPQTKFSLGDFNNIYNGGALIVDSGAPEIYSDFNGQSGFLTYQYVFNAGDFNNLQNGTSLFINDNNQLIKTQHQGNDIGLKLDFANNTYTLGDPGSFNNATTFIINDNNREIITRFNTGNEGIEIRQTTYLAKFGWLNSVNSNHIEFDQTNNVTSTYLGNNRLGLEFDYNTNNFKIGDVNSVANNNYLEIDDTSQLINLGKPGNIQLVIDNSVTQTFKTLLNGNDIGLKLDFANDTYFLTNNDFGLNVDRANLIIKIGEYLGNSNGTSFFIDEVNAKIYTKYFDFNTSTFNDIGLKLDFHNSIYYYGQLTGGAGSLFIVDDSNSLIYTRFGNNSNGIAIDLASNSFIFGRITGSNTTNLTINDGATYPVEINGTNVLSGTSGGSSGQHLKIKINGVDYKIRLENP